MKIYVIDYNTKRPFANTKIQLQVKGKDSGFLTFTTDGSGYFTLDNKYQGQQITATSGTFTSQGEYFTANEGLTLTLATSKQKTTETTQGGGSYGK